jgi:hypothetical protein
MNKMVNNQYECNWGIQTCYEVHFPMKVSNDAS